MDLLKWKTRKIDNCALNVQLERLSPLKSISNTIQLNALARSSLFFFSSLMISDIVCTQTENEETSAPLQASLPELSNLRIFSKKSEESSDHKLSWRIRNGPLKRNFIAFNQHHEVNIILRLAITFIAHKFRKSLKLCAFVKLHTLDSKLV